MVHFDPGLNGTLSFSNIEITILSGDAVYPIQFKVLLHGTKETGDFLRRKSYSFDIILDETMLVWLKGSPTKGKTTDTEFYVGLSTLSGGLRAREFITVPDQVTRGT